MKASWLLAGVLATAASISACSTPQDGTAADNVTAADAGASASTSGTADTSGTTNTSGTGSTSGSGSTTPASGGGGIPALVNVNLQNVLNNLSVDLKIDRANIPVNAQVPIDVAANVCGVSVSALSASIASGQAGCTAVTISPQLNQTVQQQVAAGGMSAAARRPWGPTSSERPRPPLALAARAVKGRAAALDDAPDAPAARAGRPFAPVDREALREIAERAVGADEVAQARAARRDRLA